jgi:DNA-binding LytR/AlgR family response regulator
MRGSGDSPLAGWRILVAEDEYLVARDIRALLYDRGADAVQLAPNLASARACLKACAPDAAVLDVWLLDESVFALADSLIDAGIGVVFLTGYDAAVIPQRFAHCLRLEKPYRHERLIEGLRALAKPPG